MAKQRMKSELHQFALLPNGVGHWPFRIIAVCVAGLLRKGSVYLWDRRRLEIMP